MTTLTAYRDLADLASRKDGEKASDARTGCEHGQLVCVELGNLLDRHVRLAGQGLDGAIVRSAVVGMRRRGKHSHGVAFVRFERSRCMLKACKGESITVELVHGWMPSALRKAVGANRVLSAPHALPCPIVQTSPRRPWITATPPDQFARRAWRCSHSSRHTWSVSSFLSSFHVTAERCVNSVPQRSRRLAQKYPALISMGVMPRAGDLFSALHGKRAWANTVAVVVPSPATSLVLAGNFADHLRADVLETICEFDVLGHGHAVLSGQRRAK